MAGWAQITAVLWIATSTVFLYLIWQTADSADRQSFAYPLICAAFVAVLGVRCLLRKERDADRFAIRSLVAPALVFIAMAGYWFLMPFLGFLPATLLLVIMLGVPCTPSERRGRVLFVGLALTLLIWALFQFGLDASLPVGTLFQA